METTETRLTALAVALVHFANEHGVPNRVSPGELDRWHGGPTPRFAGMIWRFGSRSVQQRLAEHGLAVTYADRMFAVEEVADSAERGPR
jgi:hypothetical protein